MTIITTNFSYFQYNNIIIMTLYLILKQDLINFI